MLESTRIIIKEFDDYFEKQPGKWPKDSWRAKHGAVLKNQHLLPSKETVTPWPNNTAQND